MTRQIWKTYNGIDVSVDSDGTFTATVAGVFLRQPCWEHLRTQIENESKAEAKALKLELECVVLIGNEDTGDYNVKSLTLIGLNRNDSSFKWSDGTRKQNVISVLPFTQENANLLEQLAIAKSTVHDIETAIKTREIYQDRWGTRIDATKYNDQLEAVKVRYEYALKGQESA
jgi:hypothetical protein